MTSNENDDTLPLARFSSELSVDASVDEDFIPTSQPQSDGSCTALKSESNVEEHKEEEEEEEKSNGTLTTQPSLSASGVDTLLLSTVDQSPDKDKSADFIPDTETKKQKLDYSKEKGLKNKLLQEGSFVKCTGDIFESESDSPWEAEVSKIPESPAVETQNFSMTNEISYSKCRSGADLGDSKTGRNFEESITEIIVNDSAETVDLDGSENLNLLKIKKEGRETKSSSEKIDPSGSFNLEVERCEETQIFDNSSILLLDQPEVSGQKLENSQNDTMTAKLYDREIYSRDTIEDEKSSTDVEDALVSGCALPPAVKMSKESSTAKSTTELSDIPKQNGSFNAKHENHSNSKTENFEPSYVESRQFEMNLSVSCMVTVNIKTKQLLQKFIVNVNEIPSCKPKSRFVEPSSDSSNDKSKRHSSSSSGSVYSDKTGLPFPLPKRISTVSDLTDASDSSDEWFSKRLGDGKKVFERTPWTNEYLLPLKMDELIKVSMDNQETVPRPTNMPSPRKFKPRNRNELNHIEEIFESYSSGHASVNQTRATDLKTSKTSSGENVKKEEDGDREPPQTVKESAEVAQSSGLEERDRVESSESFQNVRIQNLDLVEPCGEEIMKTEDQEDSEQKEPRRKTWEESKDDWQNDLVKLGDGFPVFARWTDKLYYSGVLSGTPKNCRWDIKFDDGAKKTNREEFLIPAKWLKIGQLVFALVDDKYRSGQITKIESGENKTKYVVELDNEKKEVTVKVSDLRLSEVMVNIMRERYKPLNATPRGKVSSDIDFDNVIIGKRVREQRTPLRTTPSGTAGTGKKISKAKKGEAKASESSEATVQGDPQLKMNTTKDGRSNLNGLRSDNGHLVEDKVISGDSPSGNETKTTCKRTRGKAKPRSLTYEPAKNQEPKVKLRDWVDADGSPIPGPSGVKFKAKTRPGNKKPERVPSYAEENSTSPRATRSSGQFPINEKSSWKSAESKKPRLMEKSKGKRKA